MKSNKTVLLVLFLVSILLVSGCQNSSQYSNNPSSKKVIRLCESWNFESGFHSVFAPNISKNFGLYRFLPNFYEALVKYENGVIVPSLAEKWLISEDGKSYTFTLKKDIKFSDGSDLTSAAVKKSVENVPKLLGRYNGSYGLTSTLLSDIETPDDYTVIINLKTPYYGALHDFATLNTFGIMSLAAYNEDGSLNDNSKQATYGTGPYMYQGEKANLTYTFVRNPYYSGEKPEVDKFIVKVIENNDAKLLALKNNEIDIIVGSTNIMYDSFKSLENSEQIKGEVAERSNVTRLLGINAAKDAFNDKNVRIAIAHALDKKSICNNMFYNIESVANSVLSQHLPYCNVDLQPYEFNIEKAKEILNNNGWIINSNGIREKDGQTLEGDLLYFGGIADLDSLAIKIATDLAQIGIKITAKRMEGHSHYSAIANGEYDLALQETYGLPYDPYLFMSILGSQPIRDNFMAQGLAGVKEANKLIADLNCMIEDENIQNQFKIILNELHNTASLLPITNKKELVLFSTAKIAKYDFYSLPMSIDVASIKLK